MRYGYARVSGKGQDYTAQVERLRANGCEKIYSEKMTGKHRDRPEFKRLIKALVPGDTVVVCKLDRLARSARDLQNILHDLDSISVGFVSLGDPWCDTTTAMGRFMLTVMAGIAELERDIIQSRLDAGIARARALGTRFGRPAALDASQRRVAAARYAQGETMADLAEAYGCSEATISRALR